MSDRSVHAWYVIDGREFEVARYARSGTWWLESPGVARVRTSQGSAVTQVRARLDAADDAQPVGWIPDLAGGARFDAAVRAFWPSQPPAAAGAAHPGHRGQKRGAVE